MHVGKGNLRCCVPGRVGRAMNTHIYGRTTLRTQHTKNATPHRPHVHVGTHARTHTRTHAYTRARTHSRTHATTGAAGKLRWNAMRQMRCIATWFPLFVAPPCTTAVVLKRMHMSAGSGFEFVISFWNRRYYLRSDVIKSSVGISTNTNVYPRYGQL